MSNANTNQDLANYVAKLAESEKNRRTSKSVAREIPEVVNTLRTKANKIRALDHLGWSYGDIAASLGIRYQHVRNTMKPGKKQ